MFVSLQLSKGRPGTTAMFADEYWHHHYLLPPPLRKFKMVSPPPTRALCGPRMLHRNIWQRIKLSKLKIGADSVSGKTTTPVLNLAAAWTFPKGGRVNVVNWKGLGWGKILFQMRKWSERIDLIRLHLEQGHHHRAFSYITDHWLVCLAGWLGWIGIDRFHLRAHSLSFSFLFFLSLSSYLPSPLPISVGRDMRNLNSTVYLSQ